jgi:hypothetical protein
VSRRYRGGSFSSPKPNSRPTTSRTHLAVSSPFSSRESTPPPTAHRSSQLAIWPTDQNPLTFARFLRLPCRIMRRMRVSHWSLTHSPCIFRIVTPPNSSLPFCKSKFWPSVNSKEAIVMKPIKCIVSILTRLSATPSLSDAVGLVSHKALMVCSTALTVFITIPTSESDTCWSRNHTTVVLTVHAIF